MQEVRAQSLVSKLRSHMPHGTAKKIKKKKNVGNVGCGSLKARERSVCLLKQVIRSIADTWKESDGPALSWEQIREYRVVWKIDSVTTFHLHSCTHQKPRNQPYHLPLSLCSHPSHRVLSAPPLNCASDILLPSIITATDHLSPELPK